MSYQLVCEGDCNPGLRELDAEVVEFRRRDMETARNYRTTGLAVPDYLARALRRLVHTRHEMRVGGDVRTNRAECQVCGHVRQYGR